MVKDVPSRVVIRWHLIAIAKCQTSSTRCIRTKKDMPAVSADRGKAITRHCANPAGQVVDWKTKRASAQAFATIGVGCKQIDIIGLQVGLSNGERA